VNKDFHFHIDWGRPWKGDCPLTLGLTPLLKQKNKRWDRFVVQKFTLCF